MARHNGFGARIQADGCEILGADREHPIYSKLCPSGSLSQQGISGEGFQREVGVQRHTELVPGGKKQRYKFCWELHLYQHPGIRRRLPLGCSKRGSQEAPRLAREFAQAFHRLAEAGYDPREDSPGHGGIVRGRLWHTVVGHSVCSDPDVKGLRRWLRNYGLWPR